MYVCALISLSLAFSPPRALSFLLSLFRLLSHPRERTLSRARGLSFLTRAISLSCFLSLTHSLSLPRPARADDRLRTALQYKFDQVHQALAREKKGREDDAEDLFSLYQSMMAAIERQQRQHRQQQEASETELLIAVRELMSDPRVTSHP